MENKDPVSIDEINKLKQEIERLKYELNEANRLIELYEDYKHIIERLVD